LKGAPNNAAKFWQMSLWLLMYIICPRIFADEVDVSKLPPAVETNIDFARDIKPILETSCLRCHGPENPKSKFRLDNREAALKGGEEGVDILPGNSAKSPLIHYVARLVADFEMPPVGKGEKLTAEQISLLRAWIDQGLVWNNGKPTNQSGFFIFAGSWRNEG
jgi:mono/diheme cytochrome c family protein